MQEPLKAWICDECGEIIGDARDGFVEWLSGRTFPPGSTDSVQEGPHGFRIVHVTSASPRESRGGECYKYSHSPERQDLPLKNFLGADGLVQLLSKVDVGEFHDPDRRERPAKDLREWATLVRRLQLPYYEEARLYLDRADSDGYFDGANELYVYMSANLRRLIEHYEAEDRH
jgi:hypothetical protein